MRKVRHYVPVGESLRAEIDVYEGGLDGLRTAEVEFDSAQTAAQFTPPPWLGRGADRRPELREPDPGDGRIACK